MKNKILKGWHAVEYMQEQKERIIKSLKICHLKKKRNIMTIL